MEDACEGTFQNFFSLSKQGGSSQLPQLQEGFLSKARTWGFGEGSQLGHSWQGVSSEAPQGAGEQGLAAGWEPAPAGTPRLPSGHTAALEMPNTPAQCARGQLSLL